MRSSLDFQERRQTGAEARRSAQSDPVEPQRLPDRDRLAGELGAIEFVEAEHTAARQMGLQQLETTLGGLVQVHVEVSEGDDRLRVRLQVRSQGLRGVTADDFELAYVVVWRHPLALRQHGPQEVVVVLDRAQTAGMGNLVRTVLRLDAREARKGVEADDLARIVQRLVDGAEAIQDCHVAPVSNAELHGHSGHGQDSLVHLAEEDDAAQYMRKKEERSLMQALPPIDRDTRRQLRQPRLRLDDRVV